MINKFHKAFIHISDAMSQIKAWKKEGETIVFTNGCFDLLHIGHIAYLKEAKSQGNRLVVGVNSDASVSRLKGPNRPIKDEENRLAILSSLEMVDMCILFAEETPFEIVKRILPDVIVKGGDWRIDQIIGSDIVINNGGKAKSLQFVPGYSTTRLEEKIKKA